MPVLSESVVEDVALAWLEILGFMVGHGPEIAPGEPTAERLDYVMAELEVRNRELGER